MHILTEALVNCRECPRLVAHREQIGVVQRRAYRGQTYWSRPVPGFGDPHARILIIGLAPGAHGANRTGRVFTGDRSGDFLYRALWQNGFANQPTSVNLQDGLLLTDAYITAAVRCVPPDNKPTPEESSTCRSFLRREIGLLSKVQGVVVLGALALGAYLSVLAEEGHIQKRGVFPFGHGNLYYPSPSGPWLLTSYHPSQQNTSTKKLTAAMLEAVFKQARLLLG